MHADYVAMGCVDRGLSSHQCVLRALEYAGRCEVERSAALHGVTTPDVLCFAFLVGMGFAVVTTFRVKTLAAHFLPCNLARAVHAVAFLAYVATVYHIVFAHNSSRDASGGMPQDSPPPHPPPPSLSNVTSARNS